MGWQSALAVLAGGGIGAVLRYAITFWMSQRLGPGFPWWTFVINVTGSLLIGIIAESTQMRGVSASPLLRMFLMTGVLGGYTTFSTFSLDTLTLLREGGVPLAFAYAIGSVMIGVAAAFAGIVLARSLYA